MDIHVGSWKRGDIRTLTITATGTDVQTVNLIDCLSDAPGIAAVMAGKIVDCVGMVNVRTDTDMNMARELRRIAALLEKRNN